MKELFRFLIGFQSLIEIKLSSLIKVFFSTAISSDVKYGRLLLISSTNDGKEFHFQVSDGLSIQLVYGLNVVGMAPEKPVIFTDVFFSIRKSF